MSLSYDYMPAILYALEQIGQGLTKTAACDKANISIATFENYVNNSKTLVDMYNEADQRGADAMADALVAIDNHKIYGRSDPKMAKVYSDNIKWLLSKRKQKVYGDKLEVTHNITADKAIIDALNAGRERASLARQETTIIDVEPTRPEYVLLEFASEDEAIMAELLA